MASSCGSTLSGSFQERKRRLENSLSDFPPGEFDYIDVKWCADFKSVEISKIGWPVFALLSINRRLASIFRFANIWVHHVKEHQNSRLGVVAHHSRLFCIMDLQAQTWSKRGCNGRISAIFGDFHATENAIPRQLLGRFISYFGSGRENICAKSSWPVCRPDAFNGLRKSILKQKNGTFFFLHVLFNNFASSSPILNLIADMNSWRDLQSGMTRLPTW